MRDVSSARYISLASLLSLSLTLGVVMVELPFYTKQFYPKLTEAELKVNVACPSFSFFNGAGIIFFAFTNQA